MKSKKFKTGQLLRYRNYLDEIEFAIIPNYRKLSLNEKRDYRRDINAVKINSNNALVALFLKNNEIAWDYESRFSLASPAEQILYRPKL